MRGSGVGNTFRWRRWLLVLAQVTAPPGAGVIFRVGNLRREMGMGALWRRRSPTENHTGTKIERHLRQGRVPPAPKEWTRDRFLARIGGVQVCSVAISR